MYVGDVEIGALFLSTQFKGHRWNCKYMLPECEWLVKCTDGKVQEQRFQVVSSEQKLNYRYVPLSRSRLALDQENLPYCTT